MNIRRIKAIAKKEFKHLLRDIRMLLILLLFPAFLLFVFGYAVNFDVKNVKVGVLDKENSELSRSFINSLSATEYFDIAAIPGSEREIKKILDDNSAQCVIVIPEDFTQKYYSGRESKIQILIDGVSGNTAALIQNYLTGAIQNLNISAGSEVLLKRGLSGYTPISLEPVFWYNPDLQSTRFLIPGLIGMILIITAVVSVSLSLVREKERGTIEQINVSPVSSSELIIGKTLPYIVTSLFNAALILIVGYLVFGVAVKGSYLLLLLSTIVFLLASGSLGILISVVSDSQQVAFTIATMVSLLPSVILSGFIFPIESMPYAIQLLTNITPAKYFIVILRGIILRGAGLQAYWDQLVYLLIFSLIFLTAANLINIKRGKRA